MHTGLRSLQNFNPRSRVQDPVGISDGKVHEAHGSFGNLGSTWDSRRTLSSFSSTGSEELPTLSPVRSYMSRNPSLTILLFDNMRGLVLKKNLENRFQWLLRIQNLMIIDGIREPVAGSLLFRRTTLL